MPELVLDSLPFGSDHVDTQILHQSETEHLAKEFAEMGTSEPVPAAPTAICLCKFNFFSTIHCAPILNELVTHPTHHHSSDLFLLVSVVACSLQVLRRAQLGLKAEVEEGEDNSKEGSKKKKPKAKAKSKGKAKGKAAPKGKGEPKAPKARGRPKKNKDVVCDAEGLEEPIEECKEPESPASGEGFPKSDDRKDDMSDDKKEEEEKESEKEPPVAELSEPPRKRRARVKPSFLQEEAGESEKPQVESSQVKKRKATKEKKEPSERSSRASGLKKEPKEVAKKARGGDGPATFARRAYPRSDYGKMKWDNLKAIFNSMIRAKVVQPSKREDLGYDEYVVFAEGPSLHLQ